MELAGDDSVLDEQLEGNDLEGVLVGGFEEWLVYDAADGVDSVIIGAGLAAAGTVEAGHGLAAADIQRLAKDVLATVFDRFDGGHAGRSL